MKNILTAALALGLTLLAVATAWLAYSIQGVTRELPAVMVRVDDVNARIDAIVETIPLITEALPPILEEVGKIRETVPPILAEVEKVRGAVPPILAEVGKIRDAVPPILAEVEQVREMIPSILTRVNAIQAQVIVVEKDLLLIAETVNTASGAVNSMAGGVEAALPLIEKAIRESEAVRGEIPYTLTRVEAIVADARGIAGKASQDAVTGAVKGVIVSPFKLLKDAGTSLSGALFTTQKITPDDEKRIEEATKRLLHNLDLGSVIWSNPESGNTGTITLLRAFKESGTSCVSVRFELTPKYGETESIVKTGCLAEDGTWQMK
jgi:surface antigen